MREQGIDEARIAKKVKAQLQAKLQRWNPEKNSWEEFDDYGTQLAALKEIAKICGGYPLQSEDDDAPLIINISAIPRRREAVDGNRAPTRPPSQLEEEGLAAKFRETVDGLGHLVTEHVRRSRLELILAKRSLVRQAVLAAAAGSLLLVGYLLVCAGIAAALAPVIGLATALLALGGVHVLVGGISLVVARTRFEDSRIGRGTVDEVGRSLIAITDASTTREPGP